MAGGLLGGGPGGRGQLHSTTKFTGRSIAAKQRAITEALQGGFRREWQRIARELQGVVVDEVTKDLQRPNSSTGKLKAITASDRNRSATDDSFAVGILSYLERKVRKDNYMLAIEFGTEAHLGQRLTGFWIRRGGQFVPFQRDAPDGDVFRVARARTARRLLDVPGPVHGVIQEPILAHQDYDKAWRRYNPRAQILIAVNKNLRPRRG